MLNEPKTKFMLINYTRNYKFSTRLTLNGNLLENVNEIKLLGMMITNDLKWDRNTAFLVKKAYARMELLRKVASFSKSTKDKMDIYKTFVMSVLEHSCTVWSSSLTRKNINDLERVQKVAFKIIYGQQLSYEQILTKYQLLTLIERRDMLSARFENKCLKNDKEAIITSKTRESTKTALNELSIFLHSKT